MMGISEAFLLPSCFDPKLLEIYTRKKIYYILYYYGLLGDEIQGENLNQFCGDVIRVTNLSISSCINTNIILTIDLIDINIVYHH